MYIGKRQTIPTWFVAFLYVIIHTVWNGAISVFQKKTSFTYDTVQPD